ncbi:MAG: FliM/FliN family flagellar motor switch protein [Planctomycetaceae bacterium]|nr:FliM/FliN family flagellar motor switch protein [Planctomycetaceae bacterium]
MDAAPNSTESTKRFALPQLTRPTPETQQQPLRVIFGRAGMTNRDLENIEVGHIIELLETAEAPLDVVRNNRLVARAIPVERDGQLAWQVTEVLEETPRFRRRTS